MLLPDSGETALAATVTVRDEGLPTSFRPGVLFNMIPVRHTNHQRYEERAIQDDILQQLRGVCIEEGVMLHLTADSQIKQQVDDLVVRGDAIEFADPAFREELAYWIGQGVFGTGWLMSKIGKLAVSYIDLGKTQDVFVVHEVEGHDVVAGLDGLSDQGRADEATASRHQHLHRVVGFLRLATSPTTARQTPSARGMLASDVSARSTAHRFRSR